MRMPLIVRCTCGKVELEAIGAPITCVVCYCDDCEAGARQIEALPNATAVGEPDGGVGYVVYRKDRVRIPKGAELLRGYKLREKSATNRMVATCCNTRAAPEVRRQQALGGCVPCAGHRDCAAAADAGLYEV